MEPGTRERNWARVAALGGRVNPGLPLIGDTDPRPLTEVVGRSLILHALLQLSLGAPVQAIRDWIEAERLTPTLSPNEIRLLAKEDEEFSEQEVIDLSWSTETIYAFMWIGGWSRAYPPRVRIPAASAT